MKKTRMLFWVLLFLVVAQNTSNAQCVVNTQTTDWREYNGGSGPSLNNFNWTNTGLSYPVYLQNNLDAPSLNIELPYFCTQSASSGSCGNNNTLKYELLGNSAAQQDINPEDGWELVVKNFGTQNLTVGDNTGRGVGNPFFVLYNRHNGKMKVFLAVMGVRTASSITLRVAFESSTSNKYTALFSHAEPITQVFKNFDNSLAVNTLNDIAEKLFVTDYYWTVSEFQTAYDPCACQRPQGSNLPSIISVEPELITTQNVDLTIEGSVLQNVVDNGVVQQDGNKTTSITDIPDAAQNSYNKWNGYKNTVNTILNSYNQKYKDKLVKDWWTEEVRKDPQLAGTLTQAQQETLFNQFKASDDGFKELAGVDKISKYNKIFGAIKGIAAVSPYVGTAIGLIEFFSEGGKKQVSTPAPPLSFNVSLDATGTITTSTKLTGFSFHNPGTIDPSDPSGTHLKPFYNNVLGVFNILEEPNFQHHKINPNVIIDNPLIVPFSFPEGDDVDAAAAPLKQFSITQDLKYVINSASNMEVELIDACFILEYDGEDDLFLTDPEDFATTKAVPVHDFVHFDGSEKTISERLESFERSGLHLEYLSSNYPSQGSTIRLRTPYVPLKCLPNVSLLLFGDASEKPKVFIKFLIRMKRTDDPNAEGVTQIITYDVSSTLNNSTEQSTTITYDAHIVSNNVFTNNGTTEFLDVDYSLIKVNDLPIENLHYKPHDITYDPNTMSGEIIATGDITIPNYTNIPNGTIFRAFGKIIVGGSVVFGDNVELHSGFEIKIPITTVINPSVLLNLDPNIELSAFNCTSSDVLSLKATQTEIDAVCNSTEYKTNSGQAKNDPNEFDMDEPQELKVLDAKIYPNPATSKIFVSINLEQKLDYSVDIMDVNGRTIYTNKYEGKQGKNLQNIDVSSFSAGVYLISVKTKNYQKTDKIIKID